MIASRNASWAFVFAALDWRAKYVCYLPPLAIQSAETLKFTLMDTPSANPFAACRFEGHNTLSGTEKSKS